MTLVAPAISAGSRTAPAATRSAQSSAQSSAGSLRDPAVDLVRAACLIAVVAVHALMVGVSAPGGVVKLENALEAWGGFTVFSWFAQMMPLFFVLGGFASATHLRRVRAGGVEASDYVALRLRRLLPVPLAAALAVVIALAGLTGAGLDPEFLTEAGWRISQPLWFLGVYVLCSALVPAALRLHERAPARTLVVLGIGILTVDVVRAATGVDAIGFANLLFVWLFVQQLGFWLADGRAPSLRQAGLAVLAIAALMLTGLSPANLFEALNPPTAALALLGVVQLAVFSALRSRLRAWASLPRVQRVSDAVNGAAMTIYSWHMPVVVLLAGLLLLADPIAGAGSLLPAPLAPEWWLSRPVWLAVASLAVAGVVALAVRLERRPRPAPQSGQDAVGPSGAASARAHTALTTLAVLTGAGGVLVILAATGAFWAWVIGATMMGTAIKLATPRPAPSPRLNGAHLDVAQNANATPSRIP